jgi:hypothetical protein
MILRTMAIAKLKAPKASRSSTRASSTAFHTALSRAQEHGQALLAYLIVIATRYHIFGLPWTRALRLVYGFH